MNSLTHTCPINIRQKSTLWWEVFNKIKIFCLATNGCSATNAIRPPPMSHTSNNYYYFFGVWKTSKEFPLETNESNCITILSWKVNSFCSTLLLMVEWSDDLAWSDELLGWLKQTSFRTWPAELKVPRPGYCPHPSTPPPQTHKHTSNPPKNMNMWRVNITDKSTMGDNFSIPLYR